MRYLATRPLRRTGRVWPFWSWLSLSVEGALRQIAPSVRSARPPAILLAAAVSLTACGEPYRNAYVIDGDTFDVAGERVRISNIDAPELGTSHCLAELDLALAAAFRLRELLRDGFYLDREGTDAYGRTLAAVAMADGLRSDVGEILIAEGLARRWTGIRRPWCDSRGNFISN